jgi:hypothetical protein
MIVRGVFALLLASCLVWNGCGYRLRGSENPLLAKEGIRRVYVAPVSNDTRVIGLETKLRSQLIVKIAAERLVSVVNRPEDADAILHATVLSAEMSGEAPTSSDLITPSGQGRADTVVFTQYRSVLSCEFRLDRHLPSTGDQPLWSTSVSRSKVFLANTQLGVLGTTSHLINESEHRRTLGELSNAMVAEVHDTLLDLF